MAVSSTKGIGQVLESAVLLTGSLTTIALFGNSLYIQIGSAGMELKAKNTCKKLLNYQKQFLYLYLMVF